MKGFIGGIPIALLAVAAQAKLVERQEHGFHPQAGGPGFGGPSGNGGAPGFHPVSKPRPETHFEPHPESHVEPHATAHFEPHPEPHYEPHPEPHFENHPEPHFENHPEPHYTPHYSPTYAPHYEPHTSLENKLTSIKGVTNGPQEGNMIFRRSEAHGRPGPPGPPGPPGQFKPGPASHFEPHPESHYAPHVESHYEPHPEPHYEPHPEPHFENHPEPHYENHPEPHYAPHYSPTYAPHYEPHKSFSNELTSIKGVNNGPQESHMIFRRSEHHGPPGHSKPGPASHFEPHPESHYAPHVESHYEPHPEPHYEPHYEPHFENHPEPHYENHPEPHYAPHYSPTYAPHYEPHKSFSNELTSIKGVNNGPQESHMIFRRSEHHGPPGHSKPGPASHFEPHPESHYAPHVESHYEPHPEPHYEPHPEPHFENHPEPHFENHPEPHYEPHYSPSYKPHYEPHTSLSNDFTLIEDVHNGPQKGNMIFHRRAYAPTSEDEDEDSECAARVHEVVHTVTKTEYRTAEATHAVYQSSPAVQTSAIPKAHSPQLAAEVDPKSNSHAPSYSMVRVHVPMATPAASSAAGSSNRMGYVAPSGVSAEQKGRSSSAPSASASHGIMFTGDAARLSGGIVSAAAAVMGVLAFIL